MLGNRVFETTETTGTGPKTLDGPMPGHRSFSTLTEPFTYVIFDDTDYEIGLGTYDADVLTSIYVALSSNSNSPVDFAAGVKSVINDVPAEFINTQTKLAVDLISTTNVDPTTVDTIQSTTLTAGHRVLLTGQTNLEENGLYVYTTELVRPFDFYTGCDATVLTLVKSTNTVYICTGGVIDSDELTFIPLAQGSTGTDTSVLRRNGTGYEDAPYTFIDDDGVLTFKASVNPIVELEVTGASTAQETEIDWDQSNRFYLTGEGEITVSMTNVKVGQTISLHVEHGSTPIELTYPNNVIWPSDVTPTLSVTNDKLVFDCVRLDDEDTPIIFGYVAGLNYTIEPLVNTLLWDTFAGSNGSNVNGRTPDTVGSGTWSASLCTIQDNTAKFSGSGSFTYNLGVSNNYTITTKVNKTGISSGIPLVVTHFDGVNNYYSVSINLSSGGFYIQRVTSGVGTTLDTDTISLTNEMDLTIVIGGGNITATIGDVTIEGEITSHSTNTVIGATGVTNYAYDYFRVDSNA